MIIVYFAYMIIVCDSNHDSNSLICIYVLLMMIIATMIIATIVKNNNITCVSRSLGTFIKHTVDGQNPAPVATGFWLRIYSHYRSIVSPPSPHTRE